MQLRKKPPTPLRSPREIVMVCAPMRSHVNLSRIVRVAGSLGLARVIACGAASIHRRIARDGADSVVLEVHRTLPPVLERLRAEGFVLVGLEQAEGAIPLWEFAFPRRTALVVGNEREGLRDEELARLHHAVEIPVFGLPHAYNAATAAAMALYEYCRQHRVDGSQGPPRA